MLTAMPASMAPVAPVATYRRTIEFADDQAPGPGWELSASSTPGRSRRATKSLELPSRYEPVTPMQSVPSTPRRWSIESPGKGTPLRQSSAPHPVGLSPACLAALSPRRGTSTERRGEPKGDVTLCVRLRPSAERESCVSAEAGDCVRLRAAAAPGAGSPLGRYDACEVLYRCDHAFGAASAQDEVYAKAVAPITESVIRGYNGAVIAYGQTGAGKTHTMVGGKDAIGMAPRAITDVFKALEGRPACSVSVAVSALEIYNERVRDLLSPSGSTCVEIHEVCSEEPRQVFRCPDATMWPARSPEEALEALAVVVKRRETAPTDMNDHSSRSHLVFTVCITQGDEEERSTLSSRMHLVDLAGSERLKRGGEAAAGGSFSPGTPQSNRVRYTLPANPVVGRSSLRGVGGHPTGLRTPRSSLGGGSRSGSVTGTLGRRDARRETVEINKSLSQLALVIQRLTMPGPPQYVPYRDSMLTRLLAESFGGSSKTCLIICCSPLADDREETRSSLDFGRRAKLVRNKPRINLEIKKPIAEEEDLVVSPAEDASPPPSSPSTATPSATPGLDLMLLLPAPPRGAKAEDESAGAEASEAREGRLREALAEAAEARREAEVLRRQLEAEAEEKRALRARLTALLEEGGAGLPGRASEELMRLEEEKAETVKRFEEQSLALRLGWQDDVARLEQEKAAAAKRLKTCITRRWQEDVAQIREAHAAEVSRLEREKAALRAEWQDACDEASRLKSQPLTRRSSSSGASLPAAPTPSSGAGGERPDEDAGLWRWAACNRETSRGFTWPQDQKLQTQALEQVLYGAKAALLSGEPAANGREAANDRALEALERAPEHARAWPPCE